MCSNVCVYFLARLCTCGEMFTCALFFKLSSSVVLYRHVSYIYYVYTMYTHSAALYMCQNICVNFCARQCTRVVCV